MNGLTKDQDTILKRHSDFALTIGEFTEDLGIGDDGGEARPQGRGGNGAKDGLAGGVQHGIKRDGIATLMFFHFQGLDVDGPGSGERVNRTSKGWATFDGKSSVPAITGGIFRCPAGLTLCGLKNHPGDRSVAGVNSARFGVTGYKGFPPRKGVDRAE